MPRYSYKCTHCEHAFMTFHSMKENLQDCPQCGSEKSLKKDVSKVHIKKENAVPRRNSKVGEITRQAIEDNREVLRVQKEEIKQVIYEDSSDNIS